MTSPIFLSPSYRAAPFSTPEPSTAVIFAFASSSRTLYTASEPENESFEKSAIHWRPSAMGSPTNAPSLYMLKNPLSKRATACAFVPQRAPPAFSTAWQSFCAIASAFAEGTTKLYPNSPVLPLRIRYAQSPSKSYFSIARYGRLKMSEPNMSRATSHAFGPSTEKIA